MVTSKSQTDDKRQLWCWDHHPVTMEIEGEHPLKPKFKRDKLDLPLPSRMPVTTRKNYMFSRESPKKNLICHWPTGWRG